MNQIKAISIGNASVSFAREDNQKRIVCIILWEENKTKENKTSVAEDAGQDHRQTDRQTDIG